jgi:hypothetical protein
VVSYAVTVSALIGKPAVKWERFRLLTALNNVAHRIIFTQYPIL